MAAKNKKITVQGHKITVFPVQKQDFISLTDMVHDIENGLVLIEKWLRNKNTIEFLGIWEEIYNPDFNSPEFEGIKNQAGLNRFALSVKQWINKTNAIGIIAKAGRYGGTYAHKDITFEFASWISPKFKLYLIKEFQRLKEEEQKQLGWDIRNHANVSQLLCLANLENLNAVLIAEGLIQPERLTRLNQIAISQMRILLKDKVVERIGDE